MLPFLGGPIPYLELVLSFIILVYVLHTYLDLRQLQCLRKETIPATLEGVFTNDIFLSTRSYSLDKWTFNAVHSFIDVFQTLAILRFKMLPLLWNWTQHWVGSLGHGLVESEVFCTVVFIGVIVFVSFLMDLPWSLYRTFVIEQRHGFNNQTLGLFFKDAVTSVLLGGVFLPIVVSVMTLILLKSDVWLPLYLWIFTLSLTIFGITIYPTFIAPLFNKFTPLTEGELKSKIDELAGSLGFPLKRVYTMDGSKRSAHSNAYMYGLFNNKRIVLFDTLIKQCNEKEVTAVLAHELGHWKMSHNVYNFFSVQFILLLQFVLFSFVRNSEELYESFGFIEGKPVFVSLVLFSFISSPLNEVVDFATNMVSRRFEFQADAFAVRLGMGSDLRNALIGLEHKNKSALNVDKWYSTFHYSHPPLVERLQAIEQKLSKTI
eukprot:g4091.t1